MIDVYAFATPNSLKVMIALEELGLNYRLNAVNLRQGEQKAEIFKAMNPNAKVPVIVDRTDGEEVTLSESAAILVHLAEKSGQLLPRRGALRDKVFEQLFFHASGVSPAFLAAFLISIQSVPQHEARIRAHTELDRVLGVLNLVLSNKRYTVGEDYSIADIAHFGWIWRHHALDVALARFPNVARWYTDIANRPAVVSAIAKTTALAE